MYHIRLKIVLGIVLALFMVMVGRLTYLQIFQGGKYSGISKKRLVREHSIPASRGIIYDRQGRPLAVEESAFDIMVEYRNLLYSYIRSGGERPPSFSKRKEHNPPEADSMACEDCHEEEGLWADRLPMLLNITDSQLLKEMEYIVKKVEGIKADVQKRKGKKVRIQEEFIAHPIARNVPVEKAAELEVNQTSYPGVSLGARSKRYYPQGEVACHVLGYLGKLTEEEWQETKSLQRQALAEEKSLSADRDLFLYYSTLSKDSLVGRTGIEAHHNLELSGIPGKRIEEIILKTLKVDKTIFQMPPQPGNNIFLTIDLDIQRLAEEALGKRKGSVIVMDSSTGEVLAMASYPVFNPNTFAMDYERLEKNPDKPFLNRSIQALLPPGSTFKLVTALAALDERDIAQGTNFCCEGELKIGSQRLRCTVPHGPVDLEKAIEHSCNVYFFETAKRLDGKALERWAKTFGFGGKTGIDLPYEKSGHLPLPTSLGQRLNLSIGQGELLVTPLQMTRMIAAIANGGELVSPHLVKGITANDGNDQTLLELRLEHLERGQVGGNSIEIAPEHLLTLRRALRQVVVGGTARGMGLKELGVAGKTGTAQTPGKDLNHAWFVGYVPFDNPRYCFCVVVEDTPGHGGEIAGPIARELVSGLLHKTQMQLTAKKDNP